MSAKNSRLIGGERRATMTSSINPSSSLSAPNDSPPLPRKSPRNRVEATKAKLSKIEAISNLNHHQILASDEEAERINSTSKEVSPFLPLPFRVGFFTTPIKK
uniref:Uncharacterized protein n=1 Tax=Panagrolaimus sp. PS1159 TaxID=55785 RepID=A0AC35G6T2_9BILA